jgi:chemotaxis protein histidine kinase CheA
MVPTRARAGGAPPPPPAPTKAQKAELAAIKKAQNARTKAEKVAAKAIEKATKDEQKATAKDVKDGEKAAAKAEKEKAKAAKTLKPKTSNKTPAEAKRSKNVTKVTNAKTSKRNRVAKAPPTPADSESEESGEEDEQVPGPKKRRVENSASHAYVEIQARKSAHEKKKAGFPDSILINMKEWDYSKELPYPEDLETKIEGPLPAIYVGGSAPQPRWLVTQNKSMPQPPGLYSKIGSRRSSLTDYGKLVWYLDGGSFNNWGGLEYPQLEELAFKCFEHWLKDPALRDEIHESLSNGSLPEFVTSSESWYPTLPPTPLTRYFGRTEFGLPIWDCPPKSHEGYYYKDYDRPSLAVQRPTSERRSHQDVLATKMLEHKVMQSGTGSADSSVEQSQSPAPPASLGSLTGPSQVGEYKRV